jgi:hypothetical protein
MAGTTRIERIYCLYNSFSLAPLVPAQISALVKPRDRVVVEHARKQPADDGSRQRAVATS